MNKTTRAPPLDGTRRKHSQDDDLNVDSYDQAIYTSLNTLTKIHEPSDEFREVFQPQMFIKQNTKAFIHIFHYLFTIYDAVEFKRRFYWPVADKKAENHFRTATVEYLNHLIDRPQNGLQLEKINKVAVVFPGGIKFMRIVLGVTTFVVREVVQRESQAGIAPKPLVKSLVDGIVERNDFWLKTGGKVKETMQSDVAEIRQKSRQIDQLVEEIFKDALPPEVNTKKVLLNWQRANEMQFASIKAQRAQLQTLIEAYKTMIVEARRRMESKQLDLAFELDEINKTIVELKQKIPDSDYLDSLMVGERFSYAKSLQVQLESFPRIMEFLSSFILPDESFLKLETQEISKVCTEAESVRGEATYLLRVVNGAAPPETSLVGLSTASGGLEQKILFSPEMRLDLTDRCTRLAKHDVADPLVHLLDGLALVKPRPHLFSSPSRNTSASITATPADESVLSNVSAAPKQLSVWQQIKQRAAGEPKPGFSSTMMESSREASLPTPKFDSVFFSPTTTAAGATPCIPELFIEHTDEVTFKDAREMPSFRSLMSDPRTSPLGKLTPLLESDETSRQKSRDTVKSTDSTASDNSTDTVVFRETPKVAENASSDTDSVLANLMGQFNMVSPTESLKKTKEGEEEEVPQKNFMDLLSQVGETISSGDSLLNTSAPSLLEDSLDED